MGVGEAGSVRAAGRGGVRGEASHWGDRRRRGLGRKGKKSVGRGYCDEKGGCDMGGGCQLENILWARAKHGLRSCFVGGDVLAELTAWEQRVWDGEGTGKK